MGDYTRIQFQPSSFPALYMIHFKEARAKLTGVSPVSGLGRCWVPAFCLRQSLSSMSHQLVAWEGFFWKEGQTLNFRAILHAIFRLIWMEGNRIVYGGSKPYLSA